MTGFWDIHNHILPGVDDGSSCMEETLDMLIREYEQGVRHVIFTPHYRKGMFEVSREGCIEVYQEIMDSFRTGWKDLMPEMKLGFGCEFHVHPFQPELLEDRYYRMPGKKTALVEFSGADEYKYIRNRVAILTSKGITCIIAHVERYKLTPLEIARLHDMKNVYIQVNAGSIIGKAGFLTKRKVNKLLQMDCIDFVASDAHDMDHRTVNIGECANYITAKYGEQRTERLLIKNPYSLFIGGQKK